MKLLLTSAGLPNQKIRNKLLELVGKKPAGIKVAFIPTAAYPEPDKSFVQLTIDEIEELGMKAEIVDLEKENQLSLNRKLAGFDVIYVNGGNTFYLLDWVRKSGFDKIINSLLDDGKVYFGVSAGSILAGPDISISGWDATWDKNVVGLTDLTGLNLAPFAISPHFMEENREVLERKMKEVNYPVIALTDEQAISVDGNNQEFVGEGEKIILH